MAVLRLGPWRRAGRGHVHADRHRQAQQISIRRPGSPMSWVASRIRRRPGSTNSCPGTGSPSRSSTKPHRPAPAPERHRRRHPAAKLSPKHPAVFAGCLPDIYAGYNAFYEADRSPGPIVGGACWAHSRRKFYELADIAASKRRGRNAACAASAASAAASCAGDRRPRNAPGGSRRCRRHRAGC